MNFYSPIKTRRLILRRQSLHDFDGFFAMSKDHQVMKYISDGSIFHWTRDVAFKKFKTQVSNFKAGPVGEMSVYRQLDGSYLGWCAISPSRFLNDIELGYRFCRDAWGHGYATEAADAMLSAAYRATHMDQILACTHPENAASIRVLEKLGFKFAYPLFSKPISKDIPVYKINRSTYFII
jgi:ribosomal-protein-alanine N-acetyltransferase